jgi:hypothetical protein
VPDYLHVRCHGQIFAILSQEKVRYKTVYRIVLETNLEVSDLGHFLETNLEVLELKCEVGCLAEHLQLDQVLQPLLSRNQSQVSNKK